MVIATSLIHPGDVGPHDIFTYAIMVLISVIVAAAWFISYRQRAQQESSDPPPSEPDQP